MVEWAEAQLVDGLNWRLTATAQGIRTIEFMPEGVLAGSPNPENPFLHEAVRQLGAYFRGELREFQLALDFEGTDFQKQVWRQLETIPYGQTRSYSQIAEAIGRPKAVRAVGAANGANPIPIVVPCHRVIGASGKLVGYGGGLPLKKRLLELEGVAAQPLFTDC